MVKGRLIAVEGIEGSGKSTLAKSLADVLSAEGRHVSLSREPGGTELGAQLREILLHDHNTKLFPETELLLFLADRAQHVREIVTPCKEIGMIVITDRYYYSTLAYQGYGRGLDLNQLKTLNGFATGGVEADLVLLVDLPVEEALKRAKHREGSGTWDRFESEELEFHKAIREGFLELAREQSDRFVILDGMLSQEALLKAAVGKVMPSIQG